MDTTPLTQSQLWSALLPWIIVCVVMLIWGNGAFKTWANSIFTWNYPVPDLHNMINKVPPVAAKPTPEGAVFAFTYLSFTGTGMLIAAIISGFLMGFWSGQDDRGIWPHHQAVRDLADHDLGDAGDRHVDAALGRRCDARSRLRCNRRALSFLRDAARLARRGVDGIGYRVQHPVRQSAEDHLRTTRPVAGADGRRQLLRWRDGQDDRRAIDRGRLHRDQLVWPRRHDPALTCSCIRSCWPVSSASWSCCRPTSIRSRRWS